MPVVPISCENSKTVQTSKMCKCCGSTLLANMSTIHCGILVLFVFPALQVGNVHCCSPVTVKGSNGWLA